MKTELLDNVGMNKKTPLGIIAGSGHLPRQIISHCQKNNRDFFVIAIKSDTDATTVADVPHVWINLGAIGTAIEHLQKAGVKQLVLAGKINRPSMSSLVPDAMGAKLIARLGFSIFGGDAAIFKTILAFLEEQGFSVIGSEEILQDVVMPKGAIGKLQPDEQAQKDISLGAKVIKAIGAFDIGQGVIIKNSLVLGVEAAEGTDALIARCANLGGEGKGGVLIKARKPIQEERVDLPTIGKNTIELVAHAGFSGIALEAGHSIIVERSEVIKLADDLGIFVVGF